MKKMNKVMEGLRLVGPIILFPVLVLLDCLGFTLGFVVRAFKEGYEKAQERE